jgi:Ca2+-binding EF-hand superfamily protein
MGLPERQVFTYFADAMQHTIPHRLLGMLACITLALVVNGYSEEATEGKGPSKEALKKYDADGDGKLSDEEQAKRKADIKAKGDQTRKENVEKYDADGDGKLSKEERDAKKAAEAAEKEAKMAEREAKKTAKQAK